MKIGKTTTVNVAPYEKVALVAVVVISVLVMIGWFLDIEPMLSLIPNGSTMKFNTALLFFLTATSIFAKIKDRPLTAKLLASAVVLFAVLTVVQDIFRHLEFFIDNLFVYDSYSDKNPGRMSPASALSFIATNLCLLFRNTKLSKGIYLQDILISTVLFITILDLTTHLLGIPLTNKEFFLSTMAVHTALLFLVLNIVLLTSSPDLNISKLIFGENLGSSLMRQMIPFIFISHFLLSLLWFQLSKASLITDDFAISGHTSSVILTTLIYVTFIASKYNRADRQQILLNEKIALTNSQLKQFQFALNESSIVAITDQRGIIKYVNQKFCEISGYKKHELVGKTHKIVNSGYHEKHFFKTLWKTINEGKVWQGDIKNRKKDGNYYWVLTVIIPFKDENGNIYQHLSIRQDITKRKAVEERLKKQNKDLKNKNEEIEQFAYIASHDLQEPLRTLVNFTNLFEKRLSGELSDEGTKYLGFINNAATRMSTLIAALLDYSRAGSAKDYTLVDNNEIINTIVEDLSKKISETKAQIKVAELPTIMAPELSMRVLWQNLISNALKFSRENVPPIINIDYKQLGDKIEFTIEDNGIGIPEHSINKVFKIFQRLHPDKKYQGHGLGLALCKKVIDQLDGNIWITKPEHEGTKLHFSLNQKTNEETRLYFTGG